MADAEVIPIGAGGRPGRGSDGSGTPSAASRALAPRTPRTRRRPAAGTDGTTSAPTTRRTAKRAAATPAPATPGAAAPGGTTTDSRERGTTGGRPTSAPAGRRRASGKVRTEVTPKAPRADRPARVRRSRSPAPVRDEVPRPGTSPAEPVTRIGATEPEPARHGPVGQLAAVLAELAVQALGPGSDEQAAQALAFLRRRITGDYHVDVFGFDRELTETVLMPVLRPLYQKWFRVEVRGIEHVPATGGALIVANHSGTVPVDSLMTQLALLDEHPARRHLRMLGADLVYKMPIVGQMARKSGATLACNEDAERLLGSGELVGVWPEGFKGVGKPFSERYKLQRFGRGGFVAAAMRTGAPIIPVSIVGAEEIFPLIGNLPTLARIIGVPYVPITPTFPWLGPLGLIPLPSKWIIEFGEPIRTDVHGEGAADDPMLVFNITDQVRETIQHSLYTLLMQRRSVFF
jgi:1-acyl-sn-glycerol-3-phosphate acyltransferase